MTNILHITASMRGSQSVSRDLSGRLVRSLAQGGNAQVITRDLGAIDLPFVSEERFAAGLAPAAQRTPEQQELAAIADELIDELKSADIIVLGVPIYNFGAPASLKAWADLVARAGTTFRYTPDGPQGLLTGRKAYLAIASGGTEVGSAIDFMTPWLTHFLGFLGIEVVGHVAADAIMGRGGKERIAEARKQALAIAA